MSRARQVECWMMAFAVLVMLGVAGATYVRAGCQYPGCTNSQYYWINDTEEPHCEYFEYSQGRKSTYDDPDPKQYELSNGYPEKVWRHTVTKCERTCASQNPTAASTSNLQTKKVEEVDHKQCAPTS